MITGADTPPSRMRRQASRPSKSGRSTSSRIRSGPLGLGHPHAVAGRGRFEGDEVFGLELFGDSPTKVLVVIDDEEGLALSHGRKHAPYLSLRAKTFGDARVNFTATADGFLDLGGRKVRCALGRSRGEAGRRTSARATAPRLPGSGRSPGALPPRPRPPARHRLRAGADFTPRWLVRRPEGPRPTTGPVYLPYPASAEHMWLESGRLRHRRRPGPQRRPCRSGHGLGDLPAPQPADYSPTQGCVAVPRADLEELLAKALPGDAVEIRA